MCFKAVYTGSSQNDDKRDGVKLGAHLTRWSLYAYENFEPLIFVNT